MNKSIIVKKIPLEAFLDLLESLYEQGVDYIDLECIKDANNIQDTIKININLEYISSQTFSDALLNNLI